MKIEALNDFVVVELIPPPERIGNVELADVTKDAIECRPLGRVVAIGDKVADKIGYEAIEVGDIIAYWFGHFCLLHALDGNNLRVVKAEHVIGKVLSDEHATPKQMQRLKAQHEKDLAAAAPKPSLVLANGRP